MGWKAWTAAAGALAALLAMGMPAQAQEYYYYPPPYYAPPPPPVYVYPPPYYPPTVVIRPAPPAPAGAPPPQFWYWCDDPQGYYPSVASCNHAWREVPASATAPAPQSQQKPK